MSFAVAHPYLLLLLPVAALPLIYSTQDAEGYPSVGGETDRLSVVIDVGLRLLGSIAIAALVLGLSGLYRRGQSIERLGEGANVVFLFDRSASMNDTFAGRAPTETGEESKSAAAKRFLKAFVAKRKHDRFGVAAFSTSPMFVLPLSDHKEATLAAIDAIDLPGLALTNVGKGLAMALAMQEADLRSAAGADGGIASRAIVLVSDGAAVIDRKLQQQLTEEFMKRPINLYWIFLRTEGSRGIFDLPGKGDQDTPFAMPERHLNLFFESLKIPYRAFEVENPAALGDAVAAIDRLERSPMRYFERIPQKDIAGVTYAISAAALFFLILAKLAETKLSREWVGLGPLILVLPLLGIQQCKADAADLTRTEILAVIAKAGPGEAPNLSQKNLAGLDLSNVDFKGADLFATDLSDAKLDGAILAHTNLNRAILRGADLSGADLSDASMFAVILNGANLVRAELSRARIIGELKDAHLEDAKLIGADLGADPANQGMVPVRVDMSGAILDNADLSRCNLEGAVLQYAKLRNAKLVQTRFNWAKLAGADFDGADVTGAVFSDADLTGAVLTRLKGAAGAVGLAPAQ